MRHKYLALMSLGLLLVGTGELFADGIILDGVTPRSIGRGGTNLGFADNGGVLFDNPAAMVNLPGQGLDEFGVDVMLTDFDYGDATNATRASVGAVPLPQISFIRKSDSGDWAYGIGLFTPAGFNESWDMEGPAPLTGNRHYMSFGALAKVLPGVSYRVNDRLSVGATLGVGINHTELEGPYFVQTGALMGTPLMLDLQATGATMVWSVGLQYEISDATTLGVCYQSESRFKLDGETRIDIPGMGLCSYKTGVDMTYPRSLGIGMRHELCPHRIVAVDVVWYNWAAAFDDFGIRLTEPSAAGFPELTDQLPLNWRDSVSLRLGYERKFATNHTLRFGYVYHRNPIPNETLTPYIQGILDHAFSVGYGGPLHGRWNMDLAYMYSFGPTEEVGTSSIVGGDFNNSTHRAQTHAIGVSLTRMY